MKSYQKLAAVLLTAVLLTLVIVSAGCVNDGTQSAGDRPVAVCTNGIFVGTYEDETGVAVFRGIPYAEQPVGDLRWKAPQPAKPSTEIFDAVEFGPSALQPKNPVELTSLREQSEACLTLDVWTNMAGEKKPVMVYIHGGSYCLGASADPLYSGQYLVAEYENLVVVSVNYRLNLLGYIDFSSVEGGEEFPTSGYNGLLDVIESLKWINENIAAFGGDPDNITVFGESAGAGTVGCLLVAEPAEGLFQHAIMQSGDVSLTYPIERFEENEQTEYLMKITGAKNMDDLMALSTEDLRKAIEVDTGKEGPEGGTMLADLNNHPLRGSGSIIPADPYAALADGAGKDVDIIIGTTADEMRYWVLCMCSDVNPETITQKDRDKMASRYYPWIQKKAEKIVSEEPDKEAILNKYLSLKNFDNEEYADKYPGIWNYSDMVSEWAFILPAVRTAEAHAAAEGTGKTYVYIFNKDIPNEKQSILGSCHGVEIPYVFNNIHNDSVYGTPDKNLVPKISSAWVNFAASGDPGQGWTEYNNDARATMVFGKDNSMKMVNDPNSEERKLLMPIFEKKFAAGEYFFPYPDGKLLFYLSLFEDFDE